MSLRLRPEGSDGTRDLAVVQIAGLVARRIVCDLTQGQGVQRGARFGIIRFGSRVDVYLPPGCTIAGRGRNQGPGRRNHFGEV